MKSILLKLRFLYLGIQNIKTLNIGDEVSYKNKRFVLSSYKYTDTNWYDHWSMVNIKTKEYEIHSVKEIKKIKSFNNIKNSIFGTYNFYMNNWYSIMKNRLKFKDIFKANYLTVLNILKDRDYE